MAFSTDIPFTIFALEQLTPAGHGASRSVADNQSAGSPGLKQELLSVTEGELIVAATAKKFGHLIDQGQQLLDASRLQQGASNLSVARPFTTQPPGQNWSGLLRPRAFHAAHSAAQAAQLPPPADQMQLTQSVSGL